jgi:hypothetical protein
MKREIGINDDGKLAATGEYRRDGSSRVLTPQFYFTTRTSAQTVGDFSELRVKFHASFIEPSSNLLFPKQFFRSRLVLLE